MTFPEWCGTISLEHGFGRLIAQKAWNARSAIADAREAELRAEIAAKDSETERLRAALQAIYDETADYIRINNLGDVHHNTSMKMARDALAKSTGGCDDT